MKRRLLLAPSAVLLLGALATFQPWGAQTKDVPGEPQWVWFNEGDPLKSAPAETRYFRRVFTVNRPVPKPVDEATLQITADNSFTVWVNGAKVGTGNCWQTLYSFDVKKHLVHGK